MTGAPAAFSLTVGPKGYAGADRKMRQIGYAGPFGARGSRMLDPYKELASALAEDGIRCQFQSAGQMVVSQQMGPIWPDRGNSFWVTKVAGRWYLFTWVPIGYSLPEAADVAAVCRTCMGVGESAMGRVPSEVIQEFGLVELTEEEAETVVREMDDG
jgi:hypothetical protein